MKRGFRIRIYPTEEQEELLSFYCKTAHNMWNFLVAKYKDKLPVCNCYGIKDYTPRDLINEFGVEIPQRIAFGVMKTYCDAVKRRFDKIGNAPKFHKYDPNKQSFYVTSTTISVKNGVVEITLNRGRKVTSKNIQLDSQQIEKFCITEIIEPRYTCLNGEWYISGCCNVPDVEGSGIKEWIGLDWGIKNFMTTSNGELLNYPKMVLREYQRIKRLQSIMDKKKRGSNNRDKMKKKLFSAYERLENLKRDFIEKSTTEICKTSNVSVEDLKGIEKRPQKFVRRQMVIAPRDRFIEKLEWKCKKFGTQFVKVNPAYTSQTCSVCGEVHNLKLKDREMICECGNHMDRDVNAAINIRNAAQAASVFVAP